MHNFSLHILTVLVSVGVAVPTFANDVPFVAAWDRFGQHDEIPDHLASAVLISELSCVACHESSNPMHQPKAGPRLDDAGTRLKADWIQDYLMNPSAHRHGTTMPDVLAGYSAEQKPLAVKALTAFLMSKKKPLSEIKGNGVNPVPLEFWKHGSSERGRELYHSVGCVACHEPDADYEVSEMKLSDSDRQLDQLDPEDIAEMGLEAAARRVNSVPHPKLHRKYDIKSLTWFLMNPEAVRPSGRMPNPGLRAVDAADLAAWLILKSAKDDGQAIADVPTPVNLPQAELVYQGARLFQQSGCANCHSVSGMSAARVQSLQSVANFSHSNANRPSCLSNPKGRMPDYGLSNDQRSQLATALKSLNQRPSTADSLQLTMLQLNCYACHQRGDNGGVGRHRKAYFETVGQIDIGDEGRLPPPLTGVGARLKSKWMKDVLNGKAKLRSFMTIQMPQYPSAAVSSLPAEFAAIDHPASFPTEQQVFPATSGLEEPGRQLMDAGCVQCHVFNGESLPGTVGIDLQGVTDRVHADWLKAFLLNPGSLKRGTRMPTFFPGGKSQNVQILHGDTSKQVSAIYAYLKSMKSEPLPQKIADVRNQDFELRPTNQPIVFRTFMHTAGMHAIAIGYPENVHVAFDAENLFFAEAWRGKFLDAQGTWFTRSAPPADPLGTNRITLPAGPSLAKLAVPTANWPTAANVNSDRFDGYALDASGIPVLKYHIGDVSVQDRIDPKEAGTFIRTLTVTPSTTSQSSSAALWLKANEGRQLERSSAGEFVNDAGLKVKVTGLDLSKGQLVRQGQTMRWLLPVPMGNDVSIQIEYRW